MTAVQRDFDVYVRQEITITLPKMRLKARDSDEAEKIGLQQGMASTINYLTAEVNTHWRVVACVASDALTPKPLGVRFVSALRGLLTIAKQKTSLEDRRLAGARLLAQLEGKTWTGLSDEEHEAFMDMSATVWELVG